MHILIKKQILIGKICSASMRGAEPRDERWLDSKFKRPEGEIFACCWLGEVLTD
jgi:hypothetical protein